MSYRNSPNRPKTNKDLFKNLPPEIVIDILSRLPERTVINCKCVHKPWFHLIETQEFVESHLSKATPGLIVEEFANSSTSYEFFKFEDDVFHYKQLTKFNITGLGSIMCSADGLLLLSKLDYPEYYILICNPITREYINLLYPQEFVSRGDRVCKWGVGSSSGQYKVVRIFCDLLQDKKTQNWPSEVECHVYTLGTGLWRRLASHPLPVCTFLSNGVFANGNLHRLVSDSDCCLRISCFDLETERFSTVPSPPLLGESYNIFAWGDCVGLCDNTSGEEIVIWLMKEYGVEESWTKEFVIRNAFAYGGQ